MRINKTQLEQKNVGGHERRNLKSIDTSDFVGIKIKQDKSIVSMGATGDVQLFRSGPSNLHIASNTVVQGNMNVTGVLQSESITKELTATRASIMSEVDKRIANSTNSTIHFTRTHVEQQVRMGKESTKGDYVEGFEIVQ